MATFTETLNPTPFGFFDADVAFIAEADPMVTFVKRHLGDDVLSCELTKKQIWSCFEQATLEYSRIINEHQAINQLASLLGQSTGSLSGSENLFIKESLSLFERAAEPYARWAGLGGGYNTVLGKIPLEAGRQDYDLHAELITTGGVNIYESQPTGSRSPLRVIEVFHSAPGTAFRFFDSTSAINYLNNEFSFESFTPETIFYVLPVFEDILRAGQFEISQKVRRSNYSFEIIGTLLRLYPTPTGAFPRNVWLRVMPHQDPTGKTNASTVTPIGDDSIYGVSNVSNVPYGNINYGEVNSLGRQWIRQMTLALCKELLGLIRSKFQTIPIPNADLTLNGTDLISQGREDQEKLKTQLLELLDKLTYDSMMSREAEKTNNLLTKLRAVPMPIGAAIKIG